MDVLLARFGAYLSRERGLAAGHGIQLPVPGAAVRRGVRRCRPVSSLRPEVAGLAAQAPRDCGPRSAQVRANAVRAPCCGFTWLEGLTAVPLAGLVGSFAAPAGTAVPKGLSPGQAADLLAFVRAAARRGLRNEPMMALLLRLALRAGEVAGLLLDDIAWRQGSSRVRGKGNRADQIPLPADVGAAAGPLPARRAPRRDGAPAGVPGPGCSARAADGHAAVTSVAGRALRDAGISGDGAAHLLRHTAACGVLAAGGGLAEAGQLLRHAGPQVTAVYARSDITALRSIARPWPEGDRDEHGPARGGRATTWPSAAPAATGSRDTSGCSGRSWTAWKPAGRPGSRCPRRSRSRPPRPETARAWHAQRLAAVRSFAGYVHAMDPAAADPIPGGLIPGRIARRVPYLYSGEETARLMAATAALPSPVLAASMRTLIGLLASTGLRSGEALALDACDLDTAAQVLTVTGKYGRNRLDRAAPIGGRRARRTTCGSGQHAADGTAALLIGQAGHRLEPQRGPRHLPVTGHRHAAWLPSRAAGPRGCMISAMPSRSTPSSTRTARAATSTPASRSLATHLGHVSPSHTYWYLTVTPALADAVSERAALYYQQGRLPMTALAPAIESFFTDYLIGQRGASPHTIASYRDTFRLLFAWIREQSGTRPSDLDFADLDAATVTGFLAMLEDERHNTSRTRSQRLAAIHSLFRHAALGHPEHAALIARVLAIRPRKPSRKTVAWLSQDEVDALLASPGPQHLDRPPRPPADAPHAHQRPAGLRGHRAHLGRHLADPARRPRALARQGTQGTDLPAPDARHHRAAAVAAREPRARRPSCSPPAAPTRKMSTDAVAARIRVHAAAAAAACPSIAAKNVTPHVLRHTFAMRPAIRRSRRSFHRSPARSRVPGLNAPLPACRPRTQAEGHSTGPPRRTPAAAATRPRTSSSPSSKACETMPHYAARPPP